MPNHYLSQGWVIVNRILRNKLHWNFTQITTIFIQENAFENVVWNHMASYGFQWRFVAYSDFKWNDPLNEHGEEYDMLTNCNFFSFLTHFVTRRLSPSFSYPLLSMMNGFRYAMWYMIMWLSSVSALCIHHALTQMAAHLYHTLWKVLYCIGLTKWMIYNLFFYGLVQERHNSSALAMELHLSPINPSIVSRQILTLTPVKICLI